MILLAIIAIWLALITFVVILCRVAAVADARYDTATQRYPSASHVDPRTDVPAPAPRGEDFAPLPRGLRPRVRGGRGRAERYVAGS
jgi:hypothetical protein